MGWFTLTEWESPGLPLGLISLAQGDVSPCVPARGTACLWSGRFEVSVKREGDLKEEPVDLQTYTDKSLLGTFTDPENIELIIKVLNGCALNQRYWVFVGGATDRFVHIIVRDTATGALMEYVHPKGEPFVAIRDVAALPSCP